MRYAAIVDITVDQQARHLLFIGNINFVHIIIFASELVKTYRNIFYCTS